MKNKFKKKSTIKWINPNAFSKIIDKSAAAVMSYIRKDETGKKSCDFKYKIDPANKDRYLIEYDINNPPKKIINPNGQDLTKFVKKQAGKQNDDVTKQLQALVDLDNAIKQEKLEKLKIDNKVQQRKYVDKNKFNKSYFSFMRGARDKILKFSKKLRVKAHNMEPHELEKYYLEEMNKILTELSNFKYYDSNDHTNT